METNNSYAKFVDVNYLMQGTCYRDELPEDQSPGIDRLIGTYMQLSILKEDE